MLHGRLHDQSVIIPTTLMYYLDDTSPENGCLRVLPGTHRRWHQFHGMGTAHTRDINRMDDEHDPRFADYPGEVDETW